MKNKNKKIDMICGIDTLYYFIETNKNYDDLFLDMLNQLENKKTEFEEKEIEHKNSDLFIELKNISLQYLSKVEGFYWFKDTNDFFKLGFKDEFTNRALHNIRVQLMGIGIYTIGLKALISFINDKLLKDVSTGDYPITRADLNCFINYDFSFIDKTMFATRKKRYMSISEFATATKTQTIYVGKQPFALRLYDKKLELKKSRKKDMMYEHFINGGLDVEKEIFNIEFEMHRTHLKAYKITTLQELLSNANTLFKKAMEDIRLIDNSSITKNDIKNNSKNRAKTLPIWDYIKDNFSIDTFLQNEFSIKRVKQKSSIYDENRFIDEFNNLIKKALTYHIYIDSDFVASITQAYLQKIENKKEQHIKEQEPKKRYIPVSIKGVDKNYRLLEDGSLIEPVNVISFKELSDNDLQNEIMTLEWQLNFAEVTKRTYIAKKLEMAYREKLSRAEKQG